MQTFLYHLLKYRSGLQTALARRLGVAPQTVHKTLRRGNMYGETMDRYVRAANELLWTNYGREELFALTTPSSVEIPEQFKQACRDRKYGGRDGEVIHGGEWSMKRS